MKTSEVMTKCKCGCTFVPDEIKKECDCCTQKKINEKERDGES